MCACTLATTVNVQQCILRGRGNAGAHGWWGQMLSPPHSSTYLSPITLLLSSSKSDMQSGFALLEAGSLGGTTVVNILFKNFADTLVRCCVLKTSTCLHCNKKYFFLKKNSPLSFLSFHFISSFHHLLLTHSFCRSVVILPLLSLHIAFLFFICRMYICMSHYYMTAYNVILFTPFNFLVLYI